MPKKNNLFVRIGVRKAKSRFMKEFKKQLRFGLSAAIGFLIAYSWREPFLKFFNNIILSFTQKTISYQTSIMTALLVTALGVVGIIIVSRCLR